MDSEKSSAPVRRPVQDEQPICHCDSDQVIEMILSRGSLCPFVESESASLRELAFRYSTGSSPVVMSGTYV